MSQDSVDDVLVFNTTVRRIDNDPDGATATSANLDIDVKHAFEWCVTRRWAQVIAAWRSMGEWTSVLEICCTPLPRLAGVTSPRHRWFGRAAQDQYAMVAGEVDLGLWHQSRQPCNEIQRIEGNLGGAIPVGASFITKIDAWERQSVPA